MAIMACKKSLFYLLLIATICNGDLHRTRHNALIKQHKRNNEYNPAKRIFDYDELLEQHEEYDLYDIDEEIVAPGVYILNNMISDGAVERSPYAPLPRYDEELKTHGTGTRTKANPVNWFRGMASPHVIRFSRHHIIPKTRLRDFWNTVAANGHLTHLQPFLATMHTAIDRMTQFTTQQKADAKSFFAQVGGGQITHGGAGAAFDQNWMKAWIWMSGNIFIGPQGAVRHADPSNLAGDDFETKAGTVVNADEAGLFAHITYVNGGMRNCVNAAGACHHGLVGNVARRMVQAKLATKDLYGFVRDQWQYRYELKP